jgi:hypothetical protein
VVVGAGMTGAGELVLTTEVAADPKLGKFGFWRA